MASVKREKNEKKTFTEPPKKKSPLGFILGIFAIPVIIIAVSSAILNPQKTASAFDDNNNPIKGNPAATVVIHEFSDYGCSHCKAAQPIINNLLKQYGDKVKFVHKDFPLGPSTEIIAQRARCAQKQNKFSEFADILFEKQTEWGNSKTTEEVMVKLNEYSLSVGLDVNLLDACVADGSTKAWVTKDKEEGKAHTVNGTPTFFLNGKFVGPITKLQEELKKQFGS